MSDFTKLDRCIACDNTQLTPLLDLREQPLANSYHDGTTQLPAYPLALNACFRCFHAQQAVAVNPDLMFKDYLYVSGTSQTLLEYFDWFAKKIDDAYGASFGATKSVMDIACNDGTQLAAFKKYGWGIWGVDPAENLLERSKAVGAEVLCDYWNVETATRLNKKFDILVAQNVFAHVADPYGFLQACKIAMHDGSKLHIQTSQADMIAHGQFDTIYHEHISFFSARSMRMLAERAGMSLEDIFITPVHGGSYVFVLTLNSGAEKTEREVTEEKEGRYTEAFFKKFADDVTKVVTDLKSTLEQHRADGRKLIGYGAAAKGNTLLNFANIKLDYIIDDNPLKQGLYTPGMDILIEPKEVLSKETTPLTIVPLAWNFFDEIYTKVKSIRSNPDDSFVTYFPKVTVRH